LIDVFLRSIMKRYHAAMIVDAIETHLSNEPEQTHGSIKRLRGRQEATFRLRVRDYRVFYDVSEDEVAVIQILHKSETGSFYEKEDK
jgi:mRNA-degrading endonuclease RelE of RelBE toxin-antitoxin system